MSTEGKPFTVAHFMTLQPCTVAHDLTLDDARDRMEANNIRHLLVTHDSHLVGVLSARDITFAQTLAGSKTGKTPVSDAMSRHVYTCRIDDPLEQVASEMEKHRYGCAVALQSDFVVGIFTTTDAMRVIRTLLRGEPVQARTVPTHLVDVSGEREKVEHNVRVSDSLRNARPNAGDGLLMGTVGL